MATIKEVAALAGVTPTTVTNVLRGRGRVGGETRERVLAVVKQAEYRPNLNARALVEGRAPTLALVMSCITNPFYPEFTLHAHKAALAHERFLLVCNTDQEADGGRKFIDQVSGSLSDGILVANRGGLDIDNLRGVQSRGTPVVICVWESAEGLPDIPCVGFDSRKAGHLATQHLIDLGHRRIGAVVASSPGGVHSGRYDGFRDALGAAGLAVEDSPVIFCEDAYEAGYQAARRLLADAPGVSALFVSNDLPALGVLNAAADAGLRVPDELSVVSITDIQAAARSRPALTTVAIPTAKIASTAVELLLRLQRGEASVPSAICIDDLRLVVRGSTSPAE